ncbi:hypothetical protein CBM2637_A60076 [Cupriavidus taiwanensis]|nr:hypothetical protein CBM2637_A60076 [Cupriavidus taiwanensis]
MCYNLFVQGVNSNRERSPIAYRRQLNFTETQACCQGAATMKTTNPRNPLEQRRTAQRQ